MVPLPWPEAQRISVTNTLPYIRMRNPQSPTFPEIGLSPSMRPCRLLPLDPYKDIGPHNWDTEATKRVYLDELDQDDD